IAARALRLRQTEALEEERAGTVRILAGRRQLAEELIFALAYEDEADARRPEAIRADVLPGDLNRLLLRERRARLGGEPLGDPVELLCRSREERRTVGLLQRVGCHRHAGSAAAYRDGPLRTARAPAAGSGEAETRASQNPSRSLMGFRATTTGRKNEKEREG